MFLTNMPPNSLRNQNVGLKMKQWKKKGVRAHSLACSILGVGRFVGAPGWD
jgi:hypothetical protein